MIVEVPGIQSHGVSGAGSMFLLPAQPRRVSRRLEPPSLEARARRRPLVLEFDVGALVSLGDRVPVRRRYEDFAARIRIETSEDGTTWQESWIGWTGGMAVEAMLADRDELRANTDSALRASRRATSAFTRASEWMNETYLGDKVSP